MMDDASLGSCLVDGHGRVAFWNRACEAVTGVTAEDVLGRVFGDLDLVLRMPGVGAAIESMRGPRGPSIVTLPPLADLPERGASCQVNLTLVRVREPAGPAVRIWMKSVAHHEALQERLAILREHLLSRDLPLAQGMGAVRRTTGRVAAGEAPAGGAASPLRLSAAAHETARRQAATGLDAVRLSRRTLQKSYVTLQRSKVRLRSALVRLHVADQQLRSTRMSTRADP